MANTGRNYRKNPHTARFLQAFHNGSAGLPADLDEEREALEFVTGGGADYAGQPSYQEPIATAKAQIGRFGRVTARPHGEIVEISGHKVRIGEGYVTEKQAKWIIDIATTRETPGPAEAVLIRLEQGFAKFAGSQFITNYKDLPRKSIDSGKMVEAEYPETAAKAEPVKVEDGRYAVEEDGTLKFFKVKNGKRAGFVFLDIQASDEWHSIRNLTRIRIILARIAENPHAAMVRYGHELGVCGRCGRTLTDEASRAAGIGPVCIDK